MFRKLQGLDELILKRMRECRQRQDHARAQTAAARAHNAELCRAQEAQKTEVRKSEEAQRVWKAGLCQRILKVLIKLGRQARRLKKIVIEDMDYSGLIADDLKNRRRLLGSILPCRG